MKIKTGSVMVTEQAIVHEDLGFTSDSDTDVDKINIFGVINSIEENNRLNTVLDYSLQCLLDETDLDAIKTSTSRRKKSVPIKNAVCVSRKREMNEQLSKNDKTDNDNRNTSCDKLTCTSGDISDCDADVNFHFPADEDNKETVYREEKYEFKVERKSDTSQKKATKQKVLKKTANTVKVDICESVKATRRKSQEKDDESGTKLSVLENYKWHCTSCPAIVLTLSELKAHYENAHNQSPNFKCLQCWKTYSRYNSFVTHVLLHGRPKSYECEVCGKVFSQKTVLAAHKTVHSNDRPHVCQQCGKTFKQFSSLYCHNKNHLPDTEKLKFPCQVCKKEFATKHTLESHRKIHTGERDYVCDVCGKSFIAKGSLNYHMLTHNTDRHHICSTCGKGFKTARLLCKHSTLHTGIKPHECDVCGKHFREKGALREHKRIHTGAMPYSCEFCGKNFRFKGILTVHRRQHTGERPYACSDCRRSFTNWANYNKHMKRRHKYEYNPTNVSGRNKYKPPFLTQDKSIQEQTRKTPNRNKLKSESQAEDKKALSAKSDVGVFYEKERDINDFNTELTYHSKRDVIQEQGVEDISNSILYSTLQCLKRNQGVTNQEKQFLESNVLSQKRDVSEYETRRILSENDFRFQSDYTYRSESVDTENEVKGEAVDNEEAMDMTRAARSAHYSQQSSPARNMSYCSIPLGRDLHFFTEDDIKGEFLEGTIDGSNHTADEVGLNLEKIHLNSSNVVNLALNNVALSQVYAVSQGNDDMYSSQQEMYTSKSVCNLVSKIHSNLSSNSKLVSLVQHPSDSMPAEPDVIVGYPLHGCIQSNGFQTVNYYVPIHPSELSLEEGNTSSSLKSFASSYRRPT